MKTNSRWYSHRIESDINVVRWGHFGVPVLVFPTAGGDAEEIERFHLVGACGDLLEAGRVKLYSCDSVAGRAMVAGVGDAPYRAALLNAFHDTVYREVVPAIRADCQSPDIGVVATGASIGAFNAVAALCRYPDCFTHAVGMSGTYDVARFVGEGGGDALYFSTPLYFLPELQGPLLEMLRRRYVILASGEGRWESVGQSWQMAHVLGTKGIPNRVDPWGPAWDHDWPTWRRMLPHYLEELTREG